MCSGHADLDLERDLGRPVSRSEFETVSNELQYLEHSQKVILFVDDAYPRADADMAAFANWTRSRRVVMTRCLSWPLSEVGEIWRLPAITAARRDALIARYQPADSTDWPIRVQAWLGRLPALARDSWAVQVTSAQLASHPNAAAAQIMTTLVSALNTRLQAVGVGLDEYLAGGVVDSALARLITAWVSILGQAAWTDPPQRPADAVLASIAAFGDGDVTEDDYLRLSHWGLSADASVDV